METQKRPGRLHRCLALLLDGENSWGFVRIQADRFGVTRYHLVVYPPGLNDDERRRLRIWRGAAVWSVALWLLLEITLHRVIGAWTTLAVSTATAIVLVVTALAKVGDNRTRVRAIAVLTMAGHTDAETMAERDELLSRAMALATADQQLREERLSPLEHEALWWRIYEQLAPAGGGASVR
jgi:hypothetical protein